MFIVPATCQDFYLSQIRHNPRQYCLWAHCLLLSLFKLYIHGLKSHNSTFKLLKNLPIPRFQFETERIRLFLRKLHCTLRGGKAPSSLRGEPNVSTKPDEGSSSKSHLKWIGCESYNYNSSCWITSLFVFRRWLDQIIVYATDIQARNVVIFSSTHTYI